MNRTYSSAYSSSDIHLTRVDTLLFRRGPYPQTHILGWTTKAKGALAGCVLTALLGFLTIVWYSMGELDQEEIEAVQQRKFEKKLEGKSGLKGLFKRNQA